MAMASMQDLMLEELREIYSAERLALRAYPRLRKTVQTPSLRDAIEHHIEQTKEQVERLGKVFEMMEARTRGKTCHAMEGLLEEAQEHADSDLPSELLEVMLVADLQKVEHFEIAAYGSACAHAEALAMPEAVQLLEQTLNEERETDQLLNRIALEEVNPQAVSGMDDEASEDQGEPRSNRRSNGSSDGASKRSASDGKSRSGSSDGDDLKSREYRDKQGNIHHHTHTSGGESRT
jgi:ferritin-like metal-binding protein YciE